MPFVDFYSHGYLKPAIQGSDSTCVTTTCYVSKMANTPRKSSISLHLSCVQVVQVLKKKLQLIISTHDLSRLLMISCCLANLLEAFSRSLSLSTSLFLSHTCMRTNTQSQTRTNTLLFPSTVYSSSLDDDDNNVRIYEHVHAESGPVTNPHYQIYRSYGHDDDC